MSDDSEFIAPDYPGGLEMWKNEKLPKLYPAVFERDPAANNVIELVYEDGTRHVALLCELMVNIVLPEDFGGKNSFVVVLAGRGDYILEQFEGTLRHSTRKRKSISDFSSQLEYECVVEMVILECMDRMCVAKPLELDNASLIFSICLLKYVIPRHGASLVIVDPISDFYPTHVFGPPTHLKMVAYVKRVLKILQMVSWEFGTVLLYTLPSGSCDVSEPCVEESTRDRINFRVSTTIPRGLKVCGEMLDVVNVSITNCTTTTQNILTLQGYDMHWVWTNN